jgi:hypothetical protein
MLLFLKTGQNLFSSIIFCVAIVFRIVITTSQRMIIELSQYKELEKESRANIFEALLSSNYSGHLNKGLNTINSVC